MAPAPAASAAASRGPVPKVRAGATTVAGRLPPEVIQRIVRQNFGRFRLCYEAGLKAKATLAGKVTIKFGIEKDGSISGVAADAGGTTMPDKDVVACVIRGFQGLGFPAPEAGTVSVVYPIMFSPPDDPPPKPAPPPAPRRTQALSRRRDQHGPLSEPRQEFAPRTHRAPGRQ